jgi:hypothetical protein
MGVGHISRKFADLIRAGAYRRISSEIYFNYIGRAGRKFSRVLKAIACADIAAITDLKAIESLYQRNGHLVECDNDGSEFRVY